jgi:hypothetical protein
MRCNVNYVNMLHKLRHNARGVFYVFFSLRNYYKFIFDKKCPVMYNIIYVTCKKGGI